MDENLESAVNEEIIETPVTENTQEVAEPEKSVETVETVETVAEQPKRDFEKDAAYARMRREKEAAEKKAQKLADAVKLYGFEGNDALELADEAKAQFLKKSVEEVRAERQKEEELEQVKEQLKAYEKEKAEKMYENDLKEIQAIDPSIKDLNKLGQEFINLRFGAKLSATEAYKAMTAIKPKIEPPKEIGPVNTTGIEKEYFTKAQLEALTEEDFKKMDKKTFDKVERSYFRLSK